MSSPAQGHHASDKLRRGLLFIERFLSAGQGAAILIYQVNTEQGYIIRTWGRTKRRIESHEGLYLVRRLI